MEERRKFIRLDINVIVKWKKIYDGALKDQNINKDVSEDGICLILDERLQIADKLQIELILPTKKTINLIGKVSWVRQYGVVAENHKRNYDTGIEFIDIAEEDRKEIAQFIFGTINNQK